MARLLGRRLGVVKNGAIMFVKSFWITAYLFLCLLGAAGDKIYQVATAAPGAAVQYWAAAFAACWMLIFSVLLIDLPRWIKDRREGRKAAT